MLIPYFGHWPEWIDFFVESCKWNPSVRWKFYTDCGEPENKADNIDYTHLSFDDYKALVRQRLGIAFNPSDPYKLCDVKPFKRTYPLSTERKEKFENRTL